MRQVSFKKFDTPTNYMYFLYSCKQIQKKHATAVIMQLCQQEDPQPHPEQILENDFTKPV